MERAVEERTFRDREFEMKELRKKLRKTSGELRLAKRKVSHDTHTIPAG